MTAMPFRKTRAARHDSIERTAAAAADRRVAVAAVETLEPRLHMAADVSAAMVMDQLAPPTFSDAVQARVWPSTATRPSSTQARRSCRGTLGKSAASQAPIGWEHPGTRNRRVDTGGRIDAQARRARGARRSTRRGGRTSAT